MRALAPTQLAPPGLVGLIPWVSKDAFWFCFFLLYADPSKENIYNAFMSSTDIVWLGVNHFFKALSTVVRFFN